MNTREREHEWAGTKEVPNEPTRHPADVHAAERASIQNGRRSLDEIRHDLERHRTEMERTLHAIEDKLRPGELFDEAFHYLRRGPGEYFTNLGDTVKHNPVPAALVGIGLGWLAISRGREGYDYLETDERYRDAARAAGSVGEEVAELGSVASKMGGGARARAGSAAEQARHRARRSARQARRGYQYVVHDEPLLLGVLGMAVGMVMGTGLPPTRTEDDLMGEKRDELFDRAKELGNEKRDQTERTIRSAAEAARAELDAEEEPKNVGKPPTHL